MPIELDNEVADGVRLVTAVIFAPKGGGKSTLASALAPLLAPKEKWILVDPVGKLAQYLNHPYYKMNGRDPKRCEKFFRSIMDKAEGGEPCFLIIDEFDMFCSSRDYCSDALYELVNLGRNMGVGVLTVARGTSDLPKNYLRNASILFIGQCVEPNQLEYFSDMLADSTGRIDYVARIRALPKYVFMVWIPESGQGFKGYITVQDGVVRDWRPKELLESAPTKEPESTPTEASPSGNATEGSTSSSDVETPLPPPSP